MGLKQAFANVPPRQLLRQRAGSQGPLLGRHYPASTLLWPCPTPGAGRHPFRWRWYTMLHRHWVSLSNAICLPGMPCSLPRWTEPVLLSVTSRLVLPSPFPRRVGVHDFAFEACSSFTRVTACRVARPPYSGLCHEASTRPVTRAGPLVSYHVYRQLHGWVLPPLANCAGKAHLKMRAKISAMGGTPHHASTLLLFCWALDPLLLDPACELSTINARGFDQTYPVVTYTAAFSHDC